MTQNYGLTKEQHRRVGASVRYTESMTAGVQKFAANAKGKETRLCYVYERIYPGNIAYRAKLARLVDGELEVDDDKTFTVYDITNTLQYTNHTTATAAAQYCIAILVNGQWVIDASAPAARMVYVYEVLAGATHNAQPAYYYSGGIFHDPMALDIEVIEINGYSIQSIIDDVGPQYYMAWRMPWDDGTAGEWIFDSKTSLRDPDTYKVKISAADTTESYLDDAIAEGDAIETTIVDPGADETLEIKVLFQNSITLDGGANALQLDGDELAPGNNHFYGTDGAGSKGWIDLDNYLDVNLVAGDAMDITHAGTEFTFDVLFTNSIELNTNQLQLVNDVDAPGNNYVYSTSNAGVKGWYSLDDYMRDALVAGDAMDITEDPTSVFTFDVLYQNSITLDGVTNKLELDNDENAPGDYTVYGSLTLGAKGWQDIYDYATSSTSIAKNSIIGDPISFSIIEQMSIDVDANGVKLVNDEASPGSYTFYGCDGSGTKEWNDFTSITVITAVQLDGSDNLQYKYVDAYVFQPTSESGWVTVDGWTTTACTDP